MSQGNTEGKILRGRSEFCCVGNGAGFVLPETKWENVSLTFQHMDKKVILLFLLLVCIPACAMKKGDVR